MLKRHEEAIPCLEKALRLDPTNADAWVVMSNSCFMLGRLEESAKAFDQAYYIDAREVRSGVVKGLSLLKSGRIDDALRCFSEIFGILPEIIFFVFLTSFLVSPAFLCLLNVQNPMDVEEYVRRRIADGTDESALQKSLTDRILEFKSVQPSYASAFAHAVIDEVKNTQGLTGDFFEIEEAGVHMGEFGVGSRGKGDFFAHRQIARIIGKTSASVGVDEMDDAGAVRAGGNYIICTVDGMHSRLSDYPFLAGFHVTRATLRDVYVMGAKPVMLFSDIHVADDGDVAKIFDYTAGITTVGEAMDVPLVTGSTLRIGGDMVLGNRLTGCVGAVGVANHLTARKDTRPGECTPDDRRGRRRDYRDSGNLFGISRSCGADYQS